MTAKCPRRRKLTQPMPHHVFRYVYRNELPPVMNRKSMPHEIRCNHGCPAPGLDHLLLVLLVELIDLAPQLVVDERSFLK